MTGVSPDVLTEIAVATNLGALLTKEEIDVFNRFQTTLNIILDQAFQRADQRYRNSAKFLFGAFSIIVAILGDAIFSSRSLHLGPFQGAPAAFWNTGNFW